MPEVYFSAFVNSTVSTVLLETHCESIVNCKHPQKVYLTLQIVAGTTEIQRGHPGQDKTPVHDRILSAGAITSDDHSFIK